MRVLALFPERPWPIRSGAAHRAHHLLSQLAERWEVDAAFLRPGAADSDPLEGKLRRSIDLDHEFPAWSSLAHNLVATTPSTIRHWWSDAAASRLQRFARGGGHDLVLVEDIAMVPYARSLANAATLPLIVDRTRMDLAYQREELERLGSALGSRERLGRRVNLAKLRPFEAEVAREARLQVLCCEGDASAVRALHPRARTLVVPNGVPDREPAPIAAARPDHLVMTGCLDYAPNEDGVRWFLERIWGPLRALHPKARFSVAGRNPSKDLKHRIQAAGARLLADVPSMEAVLAEASLVVAPIRIGGGSRLKIVEAWSAGRAVVATSRALDGLDGEDGRELRIADDPARFAAACAELLQDSALRQRIAAAGRARVRERYTWDALVERWVAGVEAALPQGCEEPA